MRHHVVFFRMGPPIIPYRLDGVNISKLKGSTLNLIRLMCSSALRTYTDNIIMTSGCSPCILRRYSTIPTPDYFKAAQYHYDGLMTVITTTGFIAIYPY